MALASGERVRSFAIIATRANELCADLHDRMPVILSPQSWPAWLGEEPADPARLKPIFAPYPSKQMICWQHYRAGLLRWPLRFDQLGSCGTQLDDLAVIGARIHSLCHRQKFLRGSVTRSVTLETVAPDNLGPKVLKIMVSPSGFEPETY